MGVIEATTPSAVMRLAVPVLVAAEGLLLTFSMGIWDLNLAAAEKVKEYSRNKSVPYVALDGRRRCRELGCLMTWWEG